MLVAAKKRDAISVLKKINDAIYDKIMIKTIFDNGSMPLSEKNAYTATF